MKNKKALKAVLIIVLVLIVILVIHTIKNIVIFNKILQLNNQFIDCKNYSFNSNQNGISIQHYYKDGKNILVYNGDTVVICWYDEETKEMINQVPSTLTATISESEFVLGNELPINTTSITFLQKVSSVIKTEIINGEKCYVINYSNGVVKYFSQSSGLLQKIIDGEDNTIEYSNFLFNELTDSDVSRPNLSGYEITAGN